MDTVLEGDKTYKNLYTYRYLSSKVLPEFVLIENKNFKVVKLMLSQVSCEINPIFSYLILIVAIEKEEL